MGRVLASAVIVLSMAANVLAAPRPAELDGVIAAEKPYGSGSLTWLFFTAYDASLWTDAKTWSMNERFALTLTYRMSFSTEELVDRTIDEMKEIAPSLRKDALDRYRAMLTRAFPAVKSGDRITALHTPGAPVRFFHNAKPTADSGDAAFAKPFFDIWLSPNTPEPRLRAALLRLPR
jgi:Chalcone isomerase-like